MLFFSVIPQAAAGGGDPLVSATVEDCEKTALENHRSVQLAAREIRLHQARQTEAFRNLLPFLTLKGEETQGKADDAGRTPEFTEKSFGVELVQPLFQGGRLFRAFQQSRENLEAVRAKLERARQEAVYRARVAYWNLARAEKVLQIWIRHLEKLEKQKTMADRLLEAHVITPQDYMAVNTRYLQAHYQADGARAEVELRLWQWTESLGMKTPPQLRPQADFGAVSVRTDTLEDCLNLARVRHPDIRLQQAVFEAARRGHQGAKARHWPQIDLNGFYGKSGAAFKGEILTLKDDWQAGVRASLQFGGSTLQASGLRQRTSPRIGQSSTTESQTLSASVGILDGLKSRAEEKEAWLEHHAAQAQMESVEMDVLNGVREAYADMREILAQLKIDENELALALTEVSVAEIRSSRREGAVSERAASLARLAQAEEALTQSQAAHAVSLAALDRAVGHE
ncbi:MAG: hypothetical protein A2901_09065 [Elusimicrobia bacterium RIFCSPLOWO2_01_FULL_54_10]|nr:MAG: hypothetical protein A2901_09065 [Elusimicrobia bacterium RIFCSPLOWO2_01_FULL_54_10]